jgi:pimeloyl-ACP methyl ester carboxylesterase
MESRMSPGCRLAWVAMLAGAWILIGCSSAPPGPVEGDVRSSDGVMIHYSAKGAGEPALVFIHGWSMDGGYWDAQVEHFAGTHRVVTVDLAGHGQSGTGRAEWTIPAFAADVRAVAEKLKLGSVVLIGHSMGGAVAVEAALAMPQRVRGIVGVDNFQSPSLPFVEEQVSAFLSHFQADFRSSADAWVRSMFPLGVDSALVTRTAEDMASGPPEIGVAVLGATLRWFINDGAGKLAQLTVPLQCINSDRVPTDGPAMDRVVDGYALRLMPGRGHFPQLEDPATFNRLLEESLADFARRPKR